MYVGPGPARTAVVIRAARHNEWNERAVLESEMVIEPSRELGRGRDGSFVTRDATRGAAGSRRGASCARPSVDHRVCSRQGSCICSTLNRDACARPTDVNG